jgi:hypothetical protein
MRLMTGQRREKRRLGEAQGGVCGTKLPAHSLASDYVQLGIVYERIRAIRVLEYCALRSSFAKRQGWKWANRANGDKHMNSRF